MKLSLSVDDGHPLDLKVAEIISKKAIPITFYIPIKNTENKVLSKKQIRSLAKHFEIGCHSYNHIDLTKLPRKLAEIEIRNSKSELENLLGKKITFFAPPGGYYNSTIIRIAKSLGFKHIRTARIINFRKIDKQKFVWHPNLQLYPHRTITDLTHIVKHHDYFSLLKRIEKIKKSHLDFIDEFKASNESIHFWFHSWEIESLNMWKLLGTL